MFWGIVLAASIRKNSNKTTLCNSKIIPLHCPLHFIASRRHFECCFFKSPHYVPPGIRWELPNRGGGGGGGAWGWAEALLSPRPHSFRFKKKIYLLLNQLKFETTDNVFIKSIHSGLWQNCLSLLAQMVVEQEADKLFS